MLVLLAGLLALFPALNVNAGLPSWLGRYGVVAAIVALALYGVLQAVDGVALKQAVDAWSRAADSDKAARFAAAEAIRWLEWAMRSYQSFMLGLALLLFGAVIAQGWVIGVAGFSPANMPATLAGILLVLTWSIWLFVSAWRTDNTGRSRPA